MEIFKKAKPIWCKNKTTEMNLTCGFYGYFVYKKNKNYIVTVTASSSFKLYINNQFIHFGPVRTAHGFFRADRINLTQFLKSGINHIAFEVFGGNINSFSNINQPSFLMSEISEDGNVILATGITEDFLCVIPGNRIRKVQRFSFQRTFTEAYRLSANFDAWRTGNFEYSEKCKTEITKPVKLLSHDLPFSIPQEAKAEKITGTSDIFVNHDSKVPTFRFTEQIGTCLLGFDEKSLSINAVKELSCIEYKNINLCDTPVFPAKIISGKSIIYKLREEKTGFINLKFKCNDPAVIYITLDEITDSTGCINPFRLDCINAIKLEIIETGEYNFQSFEPYSAHYIQLICLSGEIDVQKLSVIKNECPLKFTSLYKSNDDQLNLIYHSAEETYRQNASDIYTDCPSRERAGWLCDSFFMARVEKALTGKNVQERLFLENYLLNDSFLHIPHGMVPMCYPSDHYDGVYIPNWAMWLITEVIDYRNRTGNDQISDAFESHITGILNFLSEYENELGMLENLPGWVFIEWSHSNDLTQDVSIPSNMQYASILRDIGKLYKKPKLIEKGDRLAKIIVEKAFDGKFFRDNLIRKSNNLEVGNESTETCQYYAFFFGIANALEFPELFKTLTEQFGPDRKYNNQFPEIAFSNSFIGNYLRLDILAENRLYKQCTEEIKKYFLHMAETTGTLWEHSGPEASCNHGFASYAAYLLLKCADGSQSQI